LSGLPPNYCCLHRSPALDGQFREWVPFAEGLGGGAAAKPQTTSKRDPLWDRVVVAAGPINQTRRPTNVALDEIGSVPRSLDQFATGCFFPRRWSVITARQLTRTLRGDVPQGIRNPGYPPVKVPPLSSPPTPLCATGVISSLLHLGPFTDFLDQRILASSKKWVTDQRLLGCQRAVAASLPPA